MPCIYIYIDLFSSDMRNRSFTKELSIILNLSLYDPGDWEHVLLNIWEKSDGLPVDVREMYQVAPMQRLKQRVRDKYYLVMKGKSLPTDDELK